MFTERVAGVTRMLIIDVSCERHSQTGKENKDARSAQEAAYSPWLETIEAFHRLHTHHSPTRLTPARVGGTVANVQTTPPRKLVRLLVLLMLLSTRSVRFHGRFDAGGLLFGQNCETSGLKQ